MGPARLSYSGLLSVANVSTEHECGLACRRATFCTSFNYNATGYMCELSAFNHLQPSTVNPTGSSAMTIFTVNAAASGWLTSARYD